MTVQAGSVDGRAGVPSANRHTRTEPSPPRINGLLSRSTPTAIALSISVGIFRGDTEGGKSSDQLRYL